MSDIQFHSAIEASNAFGNQPYVETPRGLFVPSSGLQLGISEAQLRAAAPDVLEQVPLSQTIAQTEVWLRSAQTLALWLLPVFIVAIPFYPLSLSLAFLAWLGWEIYGGNWASAGRAKLFHWLEGFPVQFVANLAAWLILLNWYRMTSQVGTLEGVLLGVVGFILLRFQIIGKLLGGWIESKRKARYNRPFADFVLIRLIREAAETRKLSFQEPE